MFSKIGPLEILLVLGLALLIFGPAKLPEIGKSFGKGIREFRAATKEMTQTVSDAADTEENKT
ncbi:twin-arginine translocase TatA/TatE family subunit [Dethiobacter alkaliphilus]|uniref:Sec-independent protein translocase protein TatA n=1 Tax=Dethiobacter alkaliphilus AHT 1 TaxID=555088 RepID=C0GFV7_DETAL|nr:twin-arginine translocase TatA/TatE family subunit [Dethiobacter alkaliphilus]EEG77646.1 twin-arginine translocation protein, TatA/E family subunit [Dethiobacter alkaliphilus AHT 1]